MPEETELEDVHLETADGPKPIVEWGQPGSPAPIENEVEPEPAGDESVTYDLGDGSQVTLEKTNRGWAATLPGAPGKNPEVFYGATKDELLINLMVAKRNATLKINELKNTRLRAEPTPEPPPEETVRPNRLNANDIFDLKAKFEENPDLALEEWYRKRTGKLPEETVATAEVGREAAADNAVTEVLQSWVDSTDDYVVDIRNRDNLLGWLLRHKAKENPASHNVDSALQILYQSGFLTPDYLTLAWEELKEDGLAVVDTPPQPVVHPQPTARPRAGFGIRTRGSNMPARNVAEEIPTGDKLETLSDEEIKRLYHGILEMNRTPAGKAAIQESVAKIREGRR
jgi:hypothetical protein